MNNHGNKVILFDENEIKERKYKKQGYFHDFP